MGRYRIVFFAVLMVSIAVQGFSCAAPEVPEGTDWHQWLGPNRDGTTPDSDWNPEALKDMKIFWQVSVGAGRSSPVLAGPRRSSPGDFFTLSVRTRANRRFAAYGRTRARKFGSS